MKFAIALTFAAVVNGLWLRDKERFFCKANPYDNWREAMNGDEIFGRIDFF